MHRPRPTRGLTLIEVLVTLAILSVLALLSWRALDGMGRTREITTEHTERWLRWQTTLAQWQTDLDALQDPRVVPPLDYNGRVLRLVRRDSPTPTDDAPGLRVVAWALHADPVGGHTRWARWSSPTLRGQGELQQAWQAALQWGQNGRPNDPAQVWLPALERWELYYHRGGVWSNPLSASGDNGIPAAIPDGIRLQLTLPPPGPPSGALTIDWARPTLGGGKAS